MSITLKDTGIIRQTAISYTKTKQSEDIHELVNFYLIAEDGQEKEQVRFWVVEGVRDYSSDSMEFDKIMTFYDKMCRFEQRKQEGLVNVTYSNTDF